MEIFHTLNRGVDKRDIFIDDQDRFRFIHDLYEFNNQDRVESSFRAFKNMSDIASRTIIKPPRKLLVDVLVFCLMPNHYHLMLASKVEKGISKFMKKLNMGYAKYFNEKYKRTGALFEGRYKSILISNESHFLHLPYYIHSNPLDLSSPEWRDGQIRNYNDALGYLKSYRWSSFLDYCGQKNFPSVISRGFLLEIFGGERGFISKYKDWIHDLNFEYVRSVKLES